MKIGIISDVHVWNHRAACVSALGLPPGLNSRGMATINALRRACSSAWSHSCQALIVAGDLYDGSNPSTHLVAQTMAAFSDEFPDRLRIVLAGNHDRNSGVEADHALGPLDHTADTFVVERPQVRHVGDCPVSVLPFGDSSHAAGLQAVMANLTLNARYDASIVVSHFGIYTDEMAIGKPWMAESGVPLHLVQTLCSEYGITGWFSGDWHGRHQFSSDPHIWQIGALCPTGWDNPGLDGYGSLLVVTVDDEHHHVTNVQLVEIPGPRFLTLSEDEYLALAAETVDLQDWYIRVDVTADRYRAAMASVKALSRDVFTHVEFRVRRAEVQSTMQRAVQVTRSPVSLSDVVRKFVADMKLPADIPRADVLNHSLKLLGLQ